MCTLCDMGFQPTACDPIWTFTVVDVPKEKVATSRYIVGDKISVMLKPSTINKLRELAEKAKRRNEHGQKVRTRRKATNARR